MLCEFSAPDASGLRTCPRCGKQTRHAGTIHRHCPATRPGSTANTSCAHRGQPVRTVACASCNKSTVELPVYACAIHGECRLSNAAELADVRPCEGCGDQVPSGEWRVESGEKPAVPSFGRRLKNFAGAVMRDVAAGQPRRSPELIARIYDTHCARCPRLQPDPSHSGATVCAHPDCGCPISREAIPGRRNKLEWGAERCPEGKWPIQKTNLIFYLLPLKHPADVWQWHVLQLRKYASLFNGRRIVTIATAGPGERLDLDTPAEVKRAFGADAERFEFREAPNDPRNWETPHFRAMLEMIASVDPNEATFYAHAKGVRRATQAAVRPWCEKMYEHNLGRIDEVLEILSVYPCAGISKIPQNPTSLAEGGNWHFAGTFFWFNHAALFGERGESLGFRTSPEDPHENPELQTLNSKPSPPRVPAIVNHSHAVEGFLSTQFDAADAYCLAFEGGGNVYSPALWADTEAEARHTTMTNLESRIENQEVPVSIVIAGRNYGHWLGECLDSCFAQTYPPLEVIYVDDASTDDSFDVARRAYSSHHAPRDESRLRVIPLTEQMGAEQARNIGASEANGRALLFVDADNVLPADYLRKMVSRLNNDCPFVYPGELRLFGELTTDDTDSTDEKNIRGIRDIRGSTVTFPEWGAQNLRDQNYCESCSLIWREAFEQAGGWWKGFGHMPDWHLFLRLSTMGTPLRAPVALGYRVHGESWSERSKRERPNWEEELRREILQSVDEWSAARRRPQLVTHDLVEPPENAPPECAETYERLRWRVTRSTVDAARQNLFEFARLLELLDDHWPGRLHVLLAIEIGTHRFGSARLLLAQNIDRLVTIDRLDYVDDEERAFLAERYRDRLRVIRGDSQRLSIRDSAAAALGGPADLLFIDGSHGFKWVDQDFRLYAPLVNKGGLVVIHDIAGEPEVELFWRRLKRAEPGRCREIVGPAGPWGAMGYGVYLV